MERLHKFMAHCGISSRREAENYILAGRVSVNSEVITELGVKIDPAKDAVKVDNKIITPEKSVCYLLHKPRGFATTVEDDRGRKTVMDLMPEVNERIYPAGRLDLESEGLIILTNDGEITYFLTHPSCGVKKVYEAIVEGNVENETIETLLTKGVWLGAMRIKPKMAKIVKRLHNETIVRIIVAEGVNREVRRLFAALGHEVKKLIRLEIGPFKIDNLARGKFRLANAMEMNALREMMKTAPEKKEPPKKSPYQRQQDRFNKPTKPQGKPDPAMYARDEKPENRERFSSALKSRDWKSGERKPYSRDDRKPFARDEKKPYSRDDRKPFARDDKKPYSRDDRKSFARDDKKPYSRDDRKPFARDDKKSYSRDDRKPFARDDKKPYSRDDRNPFARDDKKPYSRDDRKPFARDDKKPYSRDDRKPFARDDKKPYSRDDRKPFARDDKKPYSRDDRKPFARDDKKPYSRDDRKPFARDDKKSYSRDDRKPFARDEKKTRTFFIRAKSTRFPQARF